MPPPGKARERPTIIIITNGASEITPFLFFLWNGTNHSYIPPNGITQSESNRIRIGGCTCTRAVHCPVSIL